MSVAKPSSSTPSSSTFPMPVADATAWTWTECGGLLGVARPVGRQLARGGARQRDPHAGRPGPTLTDIYLPHSGRGVHANNPNTNMEIGAVRQRLSAWLPEYMVPAQIVVLEEFPLTSSGKIVNKTLPAPVFATTPFHAPQTETERVVAGIYAQVLDIEQVGRRGLVLRPGRRLTVGDAGYRRGQHRARDPPAGAHHVLRAVGAEPLRAVGHGGQRDRGGPGRRAAAGQRDTGGACEPDTRPALSNKYGVRMSPARSSPNSVDSTHLEMLTADALSTYGEHLALFVERAVAQP